MVVSIVGIDTYASSKEENSGDGYDEEFGSKREFSELRVGHTYIVSVCAMYFKLALITS